LLIKEITQKYGTRVKFITENWGESKLAERYGIAKYPVVFVDDILIAQPNDFGWYGAKGKYTPWREPVNREKFKQDLSRMVDLVLSGHKNASGKITARIEDATPTVLPQFKALDLDGKTLDSAELSGKVTIVEFWATWCIPCRSTLDWFGELKRRYGERINIVAAAVESEEKDIRKLTATINSSIHIVPASAEFVTLFGDINSVPTMYIFDRNGKAVKAFFGAPKDLHESAGKVLESLLK
jgi:cytochrome c biogenesis protein CcmG/thiol:disulfide interchange protein DsbE